MEGLRPCLDLSNPTGDRQHKNTQTPLALVFTLDYDLLIPFFGLFTFAPLYKMSCFGCMQMRFDFKMNLFMKHLKV